jgi:hypothetical protein
MPEEAKRKCGPPATNHRCPQERRQSIYCRPMAATVWVAHWNKLTRTWAMGAMSWREDIPTKCIPIEYPQGRAAMRDEPEKLESRPRDWPAAFSATLDLFIGGGGCGTC